MWCWGLNPGLWSGYVITNNWSSYTSLRSDSDTLSASGLWFGLWAKPKILGGLVVWLTICPSSRLRPCVHGWLGVEVLAVIIITVTRGQPRPVFLSFQGSEDPGRDTEGWGSLYWYLGWGSLLWDCFCPLSSLESINDRIRQLQVKEEKSYKKFKPMVVVEGKQFVWLFNMYNTNFTVI